MPRQRSVKIENGEDVAGGVIFRTHRLRLFSRGNKVNDNFTIPGAVSITRKKNLQKQHVAKWNFYQKGPGLAIVAGR